ncbi:hypothetical protein WDW86_00740 [Bdellovibrionota bacterium FG-2]
MLSLPFLILASQVLGFDKRFPWSWLPPIISRGFWVVFSIFFFEVALNRELRIKLNHACSWIVDSPWFYRVLLALNAAYVFLNYFYFRDLAYRFPWVAILLCFSGFFVVKKNSIGRGFILSLLLLFSSILFFPITDRRSEMLPVISELITGWRNGQRGMVLPYFPGTILSHFPAALMGLDLRWNTLIYRAGWLFLLWKQVKNLPSESSWRGMAIFLVLNPYLTYRHEVGFEFFVFLVAVFWSASTARGVVLAGLVLTHEWALVLTPFVLLDWEKRRQFKQRLGEFAVGLGFGAILIKQVFLGGSFWILFTAGLGLTGSKLNPRLGDYGISFTPLFIELRWLSTLQIVQTSGIILAFGWVLIHEAKETQYWGWVTLAGVVTLSCNYSNYYWFPVVFFLMMGVLCGEIREDFPDTQ